MPVLPCKAWPNSCAITMSAVHLFCRAVGKASGNKLL